MQPRKQHDWLLYYFERTSFNAKLLLAGTGIDWNRYNNDGTRSYAYYFGLYELCSRLRDKGISVDISENLPHKTMMSLYSEYDLVILPSKGEQFSITPLEAMSYGCAVLAPQNNGSSSYIDHMNTGFLFDENNYDDFANKLTLILANRQLIKEVGENAYVQSSNAYKNMSYFKLIHTLYKSI